MRWDEGPRPDAIGPVAGGTYLCGPAGERPPALRRRSNCWRIGPHPADQLLPLVVLVYIGALATLVSTALLSYRRRARRRGARGILIHLMPVFSSVFATLFIGERLFPLSCCGLRLVAGGAIVGWSQAGAGAMVSGLQKNFTYEENVGPLVPPVNQAPDGGLCQALLVTCKAKENVMADNRRSSLSLRA